MSPSDRLYRLTIALLGCRCRVTLVVPPWLQRWGPRAALVAAQLALLAGFAAVGLEYRDSTQVFATNLPMPPFGTGIPDPNTYVYHVEYGWPVSWRGERWTVNSSQYLFTREVTGWNPVVVVSAALIALALPPAVVGWWPRLRRRGPPTRAGRWAAVVLAVGLGGLAAAWVACAGANRIPFHNGPHDELLKVSWVREAAREGHRAWADAGLDGSWETYTLVAAAGLPVAGLVGVAVVRPWRRPAGATATPGASSPSP